MATLRRMSTDDWDTGEWDDDEVWPDEDDGETSTLPCPACGADIYEEAERCPICGEYVERTTTVWAGRPGWWVILGGLGVIATIIALTSV